MENKTRLERWLDRSLARAETPRGGAAVIATVTTIATLGAGLLMTAVDHRNFTTLGQGLWWAVQTVTTVGYGDVVPTNTAGQLVAAAVMLIGLAFLSVITAAITSSLVARATEERARRAGGGAAPATEHDVRDINERLDRIEALSARTLITSNARRRSHVGVVARALYAVDLVDTLASRSARPRTCRQRFQELLLRRRACSRRSPDESTPNGCHAIFARRFRCPALRRHRGMPMRFGTVSSYGDRNPAGCDQPAAISAQLAEPGLRRNRSRRAKRHRTGRLPAPACRGSARRP